MAHKTLTISMPDNMAEFVKHEVKKGDFASTSDFIRILVREYQAQYSEKWIDNLIEQRRATAEPHNLISQEDLEREILGRNVAAPAD